MMRRCRLGSYKLLTSIYEEDEEEEEKEENCCDDGGSSPPPAPDVGRRGGGEEEEEETSGDGENGCDSDRYMYSLSGTCYRRPRRRPPAALDDHHHHHRDEFGFRRFVDSIIMTGVSKGGDRSTTYSLFGSRIVYDLESGVMPVISARSHFSRHVVDRLLTTDETAIDKHVTEAVERLRLDRTDRTVVTLADGIAPCCVCCSGSAGIGTRLFYAVDDDDDRLSCDVYQPCGDVETAVPTALVACSLTTIVIAHEMALRPGTLSHTVGEAHVTVSGGGCVRRMKRSMKRVKFPTLRIVRTGDILEVWDVSVSSFK